MSLRVEDEPPRSQNALPPLASLLPRAVALRPPAVQEVGGVKQQVQVLDGFGEEEGLHPVVQLVVSQVFHLQQDVNETFKVTSKRYRKRFILI